MRVVTRYLAREIYKATAFVFVAFLALFAFFDLINELDDVGKGHYRLQHAFLFVLLSLPGHVYELFPIAVLIGTLYALPTLAANSEYTVMRVSGFSPLQAAGTLARDRRRVRAAHRAVRRADRAGRGAIAAQRLRLDRVGAAVGAGVPHPGSGSRTDIAVRQHRRGVARFHAEARARSTTSTATSGCSRSARRRAGRYQRREPLAARERRADAVRPTDGDAACHACRPSSGRRC